MISQLLKNYNSVIVLDGTVPSKKLLSKLCRRKHVLCADGAYKKVSNYGLHADFISGDFDSLDKNLVDEGIHVNHIEDQNSTDFEKAIDLVRQQQIGPSLITGFSGGEIDHIIGNISILVKFFDKTNKHEFCFLDQDSKGHIKFGMVIHDKFNSELKHKSIISLIPFPEAVVSSIGLKYEMDELELKQTSGLLGLRNETSSNGGFTITVHKGLVLLIADISYLFG
ncbi:MAG: thiamine diphosphokinase [Rickettsiales bacterium]